MLLSSKYKTIIRFIFHLQEILFPQFKILLPWLNLFSCVWGKICSSFFHTNNVWRTCHYSSKDVQLIYLGSWQGVWLSKTWHISWQLSQVPSLAAFTSASPAGTSDSLPRVWTAETYSRENGTDLNLQMTYFVITKCFPPQNRTASSMLLMGKVPALCYPLYHIFWEGISCLMQT